MDMFVSLLKNKFFFFVFLFFVYSAPLFAGCTYKGKNLNSSSAYYFVSEPCNTCVAYCCPDGVMSSEDCSSVSGLISYSESCTNHMCGIGYAMSTSSDDCIECDNIPANGYATASGRYEDIDGYYVCPFECNSGYKKST